MCGGHNAPKALLIVVKVSVMPADKMRDTGVRIRLGVRAEGEAGEVRGRRRQVE